MSASNTGISKRGIDLLRDPRLNKSTGFTEAEREAFMTNFFAARAQSQAARAKKRLAGAATVKFEVG